jgi:hypothetical protein
MDADRAALVAQMDRLVAIMDEWHRRTVEAQAGQRQVAVMRSSRSAIQ